ncbi:MAG: PQQ-binding-like beta-propeller repeat protein [Chloroflexota bacterium]
MNVTRRLPLRRAIILLVLASFVLAACGRSPDSNWPGMTADQQGVVYVAYGAGVTAVDVKSNEQLWTFSPQSVDRSAAIFAPPTVVDGRVVFGDFGASSGFFSPGKNVSVYSLDASDGAVNSNWPSSPTAKDGTSAQDRIVAPALVADNTIFFGTADNMVFALDAETAQPVWSAPFKAAHSIWGQPAYIDGVVYVPSLDKTVYALDASDGSIIWETGVEGSVSDRVVSNSDLVYVGSFDGHAYALDSQSGEIRWSAPAEATAAVWGAPVYVDGVVYFADLEGNVFAVDGETGTQLWNVSGAGYVVGQPVYLDGKLLVASAGDPSTPTAERSGELIAYDAASGSELWRRSTDQPLFSTPVIADDTIVVAQENAEALLVYFNADGDETGTFALPTSQE